MVRKVNTLAGIRLRSQPTHRKTAHQFRSKCDGIPSQPAQRRQGFMLKRCFIRRKVEGISTRRYGSHESINPELVRSVQRHPWLPKHQKKQGSLEDFAISTKQPCGFSRKVPTLRHVASSFQRTLWIVVTDKIHARNDIKSKFSCNVYFIYN